MGKCTKLAPPREDEYKWWCNKMSWIVMSITTNDTWLYGVSWMKTLTPVAFSPVLVWLFLFDLYFIAALWILDGTTINLCKSLSRSFANFLHNFQLYCTILWILWDHQTSFNNKIRIFLVFSTKMTKDFTKALFESYVLKIDYANKYCKVLINQVSITFH